MGCFFDASLFMNKNYKNGHILAQDVHFMLTEILGRANINITENIDETWWWLLILTSVSFCHTKVQGLSSLGN